MREAKPLVGKRELYFSAICREPTDSSSDQGLEWISEVLRWPNMMPQNLLFLLRKVLAKFGRFSAEWFQI